MGKKKQQRQSTRRAKKKGSSPVIPIIVGIVLVAIIVGAIASIEMAQGSSGTQSGDGQGNTSQALNTNSIPYPSVPRASLQETQDKMLLGQAILVDVRNKGEYDQSHAAGAISIPEEEMGARKEDLPRDKEIILYCTWSQEQLSARVAQNLRADGLTNVKALLGGFAAWQRAGFPLESTTP